jgi:hypothetical protein
MSCFSDRWGGRRDRDTPRLHHDSSSRVPGLRQAHDERVICRLEPFGEADDEEFGVVRGHFAFARETAFPFFVRCEGVCFCGLFTSSPTRGTYAHRLAPFVASLASREYPCKGDADVRDDQTL